MNYLRGLDFFPSSREVSVPKYDNSSREIIKDDNFEKYVRSQLFKSHLEDNRCETEYCIRIDADVHLDVKPRCGSQDYSAIHYFDIPTDKYRLFRDSKIHITYPQTAIWGNVCCDAKVIRNDL